MYLARKVSGHIYVLDVGVYVPSARKVSGK